MADLKQVTQSLYTGTHDWLTSASWHELAATTRPWRGTGARLTRGQAYTLLAEGRIAWSAKRPHLHAGAGFHLWARVAPGGRIVNVTRNSGSFVADVDGELELGIYLGMWADEYGALATPDSAYAKLSGQLGVCVLCWQVPAADGLAALAPQLDRLAVARAERERLACNVRPPYGWDYLIETGTSDIFRPCPAPGDGHICVDADDDQGIIRKSVDWPLTPTTQLNWRWRVQTHPSTVAEDTPYTHDYVSLGAAFDNGRDLTWIWSSSLPLDYWFACPISAWSARESHYVVRNSAPDPHTWQCESRSVHADVERAMGPAPTRIVAIWLIALATFQHGRVRAQFADIELLNAGERCRVL